MIEDLETVSVPLHNDVQNALPIHSAPDALIPAARDNFLELLNLRLRIGLRDSLKSMMIPRLAASRLDKARQSRVIECDELRIHRFNSRFARKTIVPSGSDEDLDRSIVRQ